GIGGGGGWGSRERASSAPLKRFFVSRGASSTPYRGSIWTELDVGSMGTVPVPVSRRGWRFRPVEIRCPSRSDQSKARGRRGRGDASRASAKQGVPSDREAPKTLFPMLTRAVVLPPTR